MSSKSKVCRERQDELMRIARMAQTLAQETPNPAVASLAETVKILIEMLIEERTKNEQQQSDFESLQTLNNMERGEADQLRQTRDQNENYSRYNEEFKKRHGIRYKL